MNEAVKDIYLRIKEIDASKGLRLGRKLSRLDFKNIVYCTEDGLRVVKFYRPALTGMDRLRREAYYYTRYRSKELSEIDFVETSEHLLAGYIVFPSLIYPTVKDLLTASPPLERRDQFLLIDEVLEGMNTYFCLETASRVAETGNTSLLKWKCGLDLETLTTKLIERHSSARNAVVRLALIHESISQRVVGRAIRCSFVNGDTSLGDIFYDGGLTRFIDWEFCHVGPKEVDLAGLFCSVATNLFVHPENYTELLQKLLAINDLDIELFALFVIERVLTTSLHDTLMAGAALLEHFDNVIDTMIALSGMSPQRSRRS